MCFGGCSEVDMEVSTAELALVNEANGSPLLR